MTPLDVNNRGQVAGYAQVGDGSDRHAFFYNGKRLLDLGTLGGNNSYARSLNDAGQIVGESKLASNGFGAFFWEKGAMRDLGTLGGSGASAYGINESGKVVGSASDNSGRFRAFLYNGHVMNDIDKFNGSAPRAINNAATVVGWIAGTSNFAWADHHGEVTKLYGLSDSSVIANDVNDAGVVVGYSRSTSGSSHAVVWRNGVIKDLGTLGASISDAWGINDRGHVVGKYGVPNGYTRAFIFRDGMVSDLNNFIPASSGWILRSATSISDVGHITGTGLKDGKVRAFLLTPRVLSAPIAWSIDQGPPLPQTQAPGKAVTSLERVKSFPLTEAASAKTTEVPGDPSGSRLFVLARLRSSEPWALGDELHGDTLMVSFGDA